MATITVSAQDFIPFSESPTPPVGLTNPIHTFETLIFSEEAKLNNPKLYAVDGLLITEDAHQKDITVNAADTISFVDIAQRGPTMFAFDLLSLNDTAGLYRGGPVVDALNIVESSTVQVNKPGIDALVLTEVATYKINRYLSVTDTLVFIDFAQGYITTCRDIDNRLVIEFASPAVAPVAFHELVVPDFGDIRQRDFQRINRRSRANDLIIYRDNDWTIADRFNFKLSTLTAAQKDNFINFLEFTTGQLVRLRDYENNYWHGFIMNPNMPFTQIRPCLYECEVQFTGRVVQNGYV